MNLCTFSGYVGKVFDLKRLQSGKHLCKFSLAVWQGRDKESMWLEVTGWDEMADLIATLEKGNKVFVCGKLQSRKHEDKTYYEVIARDLGMVLRPKTLPDYKPKGDTDYKPMLPDADPFV